MAIAYCSQCGIQLDVRPARLRNQKHPQIFCSRIHRWDWIRLNGNPIKGKSQGAKKDPQERFWSKVDKITSDKGCWIWTAGTDKDGYGMFWLLKKGQNIRATHFSYMLYHGSFPDKSLFLCHQCDNPQCVNPRHLFLATNEENMIDAKNKGRLESNRAINFVVNK